MDGRGECADEERPGDWWSSYFDRDFFHLYRPFLPEDQTREEVDGTLQLLGLDAGADVLDLACGWGRHSLELARSGLRVTGLDRSEALLRLAQSSAVEQGLPVAWVRADMRHLPFASAFDGVISLFSSLGYFASDPDELSVLRGVSRVMRPGGLFLLDVMHRDHVVREFVERDWWEGESGEHVWVEREFDAVAGVSREWLRWRHGKRTGEKHHTIRVRSATEWAQLLETAGLTPEEWMGSWDLSPLDHRSERLIVLCRRSG